MESGFPLDIPIDELCVARESAQIEHVHMNAFDGKFWGWTSAVGGKVAWTPEPLVSSKGTFPKTKTGLSWTIALVIGQHNYS